MAGQGFADLGAERVKRHHVGLNLGLTVKSGDAGINQCPHRRRHLIEQRLQLSRGIGRHGGQFGPRFGPRFGQETFEVAIMVA